MPADGQLINLLANGGAMVLLAIIVVALLNEWVFTRRAFKAMEEERNFWRRIALKGKGVLSKAESELDMESSE